MGARKQTGSTLVMAIIGIGLSGLAASILASMISNYNRSVQSIGQKLELLNIQQEAAAILGNAQICACNFDQTKTSNPTPFTFDSNLTGTQLASEHIPMNQLFADCSTATATNPIYRVGEIAPSTGNLRVESMELTNITRVGATYFGDFVLKINSSNLVMGRKSPVVKLQFSADVTNPAAARISQCSAVGSGSGGGMPTGTCTTLLGDISSPNPVCRVGSPNGPRSIYYNGFVCDCPPNSRAIMCMGSVLTDPGQGGEAQIPPTYESAGGVSSGHQCTFAKIGMSINATLVCCE